MSPSRSSSTVDLRDSRTVSSLQEFHTSASFEKVVVFLSLVFVFVLPIRDSFLVVDSPPTTIGFIVGIIFGGAWLIYKLQDRMIAISYPFHVLLLLFVLWSGLSLLWAGDQLRALNRTIQYTYIVAVIVAIYDLYVDRSRINPLLLAYTAGTFLLVLGTLSVFLLDPDANWRRVTAFGYNPNKLGTFITFGVPVAYYVVKDTDDSSLIKMFSVSYILLAIPSVLLTGSRGAILSLATILVLIAGIELVVLRDGILSFRLVLGIFTVSAISLYMLPERTWARIADLPAQFISLDFGNRHERWIATIELIVEYPLLGVGASNMSTEVAISAHNQFLSIFANHGLVGFAIFLGLLLYLWKCSLRDYGWMVFILGWIVMNLINEFALVISLVLLSLIVADSK